MSGPPSADYAIAASGVSKAFRLPHEQVHTLKERVVHPFRRRTHEELHALTDVSFEVGSGAFFGVVGRNGSGKSTLMKCVAGIYRANAGEIWARGRMASFIELGVGFNPDLAARDNVLTNAIMLGLSPAQARERFDDVIAFAELEGFVDLKLKNYSSGMQVRLAFASMIHVDADILLIDEVLAVGDASFQQKCHDALDGLHRRGKTIVLVTHDMTAVQRFCDRALLLEGGRLVAIDEPHVVTRRYNELNFRSSPHLAGAHTGDGTAGILDCWFEDASGARTDVLPHDEACGICMRVQFRADATDPAFGVALTDGTHRLVTTDSSAAFGQRSGSFAAGEQVDVAFRVRNVLATGQYHASPEIRHAGGGRRLMDHRDNAATAYVTGARGGQGVLELPRSVEITRVDERVASA
ncbi:MAG: ABC transporter ATP-binding protein [Actinomycetota bacterium]|nr:ABC transporter ATP-binding protein [Actinomycetota bacterium]MDQ3719216.1 ABC transporter ATP-binding protein [Actinomycetota bacterium]